MTLASNSVLPTLILGLIVGMSALALAANELGGRAGLPLPKRILLSAALGLGVLSVGVKALILAALSEADGRSLAHAGMAVRTTVEAWAPDVAEDRDATAAVPKPLGFRTWRALPARAPEPPSNPSSAEKVALGRLLFHDSNLSLDRSLSCASCHVLAKGGDDGARYSTGVGGLTGDRNAPTVLNAAFLTRLFWDGRARSLERQAIGPLTNPVEMAMPSIAAIEARVAEDPRYPPLFERAFPNDGRATITNITRAIAAFERALITPDAPYDRYVRGDDAMMSQAALRGMALFDEIGCRSCHIDPTFSAAGAEKPLGVFRRFPVHMRENPFLDRYDLLVGGRPARFRVPSLRNVALTAPYFHNGSVEQLEEAIRIMATLQLGLTLSDDPQDDVRVISSSVTDGAPGRNLVLLRDQALSEQEIADIAEFLRSLTAPAPPHLVSPPIGE